MSLPLRLSVEIPNLLHEHPAGLTFDQLVDLSISRGVAQWEAGRYGRSQVASDMAGTLGCAPHPAWQAYEQKHNVFRHRCTPACRLEKPFGTPYFVPGEKDQELYERWKDAPPDTLVRNYHFLGWECRDGKYFLIGAAPAETPERVTLVNQFFHYAKKRGLTNTQYLRMFIPVCINDVIAEAKKNR